MKKLLFIFLIVSGLFFAKETLAVSVYYSVGQDGTTDRKVASTVTIASGVATFSAAQTGNIGVGDRVTYNTSVIAYISAKQSTTVWNLVTATGATPADITGSTVVSILREYTSLAAAEAGALDANHINSATGDLVTQTTILNLPCYYDTGADTTAVTIDGWITSADYYIKIYTPNNTSTEANTSQRHDGKWNDTKYRLNPSADTGCIAINDDNVKIEGLQCKLTAGSSNSAIAIAADYIYISKNILKASINAAWGIGHCTATSHIYIYNNIFYDFNGTTSGGIGICDNRVGINAYIYNNTFFSCLTGVKLYGSDAYATVKNNIYQSDGLAGAVGYFTYYPANFVNSDYNLSDLAADAPGANSRNSTTVTFADEAGDDFHLASNDAGARNYGVADPGSGLFSDDIDGQTRPGESIWDIGADEYVVAASTPAIWNVIKINGARAIINGARVIIP